MSRPQRVTDDQIRTAARHAFLDGGSAATLATISSQLGITQAALLHRTGTKEALLVDALCPGRPPSLDALQAGPDLTRALLPQLLDLLRPFGPFLQEVAPSLLVLRQAGIPWERVMPPGEPPPVLLRRLLARYLERARSLLARPIDAAAISEALFGALEARAFNRFLGGDSFAPGHDDDTLRALLAALFPESSRC